MSWLFSCVNRLALSHDRLLDYRSLSRSGLERQGLSWSDTTELRRHRLLRHVGSSWIHSSSHGNLSGIDWLLWLDVSCLRLHNLCGNDLLRLLIPLGRSLVHATSGVNQLRWRARLRLLSGWIVSHRRLKSLLDVKRLLNLSGLGLNSLLNKAWIENWEFDLNFDWLVRLLLHLRLNKLTRLLDFLLTTIIVDSWVDWIHHRELVLWVNLTLEHVVFWLLLLLDRTLISTILESRSSFCSI